MKVLRLKACCNGFSLVELIVVMAIVGTLLATATLSFNSFQRKAKIESQTQEIFSDLNNARLTAMYQKKRQALVFQPTNYQFKSYSTENENRITGGTTQFTKDVSYQITKKSGAVLADRIIEFNIRGFTSDIDTIRVNPVNSGASYDCIVIHDARTNLGKMDANGMDCNFK